MRRANVWKTATKMFLGLVLIGSPAGAQMSGGQGHGRSHGMEHGQGMGSGMGQGKGIPMYDPSSEVIVTGTVEEISEQRGSMGVMGTHLVVKTEEGNLDVHLGPSGYLAEQRFSLTPGDQIEVVGAKAGEGAAVYIIAREVKHDGKALILRDDQGRPAWAPAGRGPGGQGGAGKGRDPY